MYNVLIERIMKFKRHSGLSFAVGSDWKEEQKLGAHRGFLRTVP